MKLPLGIQDFAKLRKGGYTYVDKTQQIFGLADRRGYYFLSRPRRFGKSLVVSTLHELFRSRRELFAGLWIEDQWDWERRHPVIWLKFASSGFQTLGLEAAINQMLGRIANENSLELPDSTHSVRFQSLIEQLYEKEGPVVILVDEYDKPLIEYVDDRERMDANRDVLKAFYSVLKDAGAKVELLFITGVSAFSQVSIFSDLNNLTNLTLHPKAATLVGITPEEVESTFAPLLESVDREKMRQWYNGYSWNGRDRLYNPWSLLSFFDTEGMYQNYWFQTGKPTFLVKLMREHRIYRIDELSGGSHALLQFDIDRFQTVPILFQTGYLTISAPPDEWGTFPLTYPNQEVRQALDYDLLIEYTDSVDPPQRVGRIREAVYAGDVDRLVELLNATLAEVPYDHWATQDEHFFHAIFVVTFRLVGIPTQPEAHTARGRCDIVLETPRYIYVLEFKLDRPAAVALAQIQERGYFDRFADDPRKKLAVGVSVGQAEKRILEWEVVEVKTT